MPRIKDLKGKRYGRLVILGDTGRRGRSREVLWECQCDCGKRKLVSGGNLRSGETKSCGCYARERAAENSTKRTREKHPNWKGGRRRCHEYMMILKPEHPHADCMGYVYEHRLVMEAKLGRYLRSEEVVHHIDRNPKNNNEDNLLIYPNQKAHMEYHARERWGCVGAENA